MRKPGTPEFPWELPSPWGGVTPKSRFELNLYEMVYGALVGRGRGHTMPGPHTKLPLTADHLNVAAWVDQWMDKSMIMVPGLMYGLYGIAYGSVTLQLIKEKLGLQISIIKSEVQPGSPKIILIPGVISLSTALKELTPSEVNYLIEVINFIELYLDR